MAKIYIFVRGLQAFFQQRKNIYIKRLDMLQKNVCIKIYILNVLYIMHKTMNKSYVCLLSE